MYAREDGLCSGETTIGHFFVSGHRVKVGPVALDGGAWAAYCHGCGAVQLTDTEGEARRWAELHLGTYRPMRPN